ADPPPPHQLGLPARHALDRCEDECRGIEDGPERADPRQVVVAGPEEPEQRVRHVGIEDLDLPALPLAEERRQVVVEAEPGEILEEDDRRQRGAGLALEDDTGTPRRWSEPSA